ncbi:5-oxoprolinase subunit PxpB [Winogradskyella sp.]|jgi:inhibitor of KinA|uniref:5-oxoprolinase subunit PxpB n=1 Tax=Winogradskyella sp. TaxID=1883156 RepID=UPI0025FBC0A9|nr:5-oxoprolinase subunit PxpB [Winogradskyella sp.]MCT4629761.1 5-oxoprolinase subunit PxpB [Winogradskyella sp.]
MHYKLRYSRYNERSILIEWPSVIDKDLLKNILNFKKHIQNKCIKEIVELVFGYNSLLIIYKSTIDNVNGEIFELKSIYEDQDNDFNESFKIWEIPVCYDKEFAVDLETFSKEKKLSISEIIKLHSNVVYTVFFIGFLPGFLYLGELDERLHLDRKSTPSFNVKKGSVAIGGNQTGIYPQDSPGGWHIIGKTPIDLFHPNFNPPCQIQAGDQLKFKPICKLEYQDLKQQVVSSSFQLKQIQPNA